MTDKASPLPLAAIAARTRGERPAVPAPPRAPHSAAPPPRLPRVASSA